MPIDPFKIATAVLSAALAYDIKVARHNRKVQKQIVQENETLKDLTVTFAKRADFLAHKLDEAGVQLDEFEAIVLRNL